MTRLTGVGLLLLLLGGIHACTTTSRSPVGSREARKPARVEVFPPSTGNRKFHTVRPGDTLYSIAWRYGHDYKTLASWNRITSPFTIYPGQVIHFKPIKPPPRTKPRRAAAAAEKPRKRKKAAPPPPVAGTQKPARTDKAASIRWQWPVRGELLSSSTPTAQKGISISGKTGEKIVAAAAGQVVYSGSGLRRYGKLIIIKHNETYLSAYAHNRELMVAEGETVTVGQQISTMGLDSKGTPVLHFEIRRNGKPIDPLQHLPRS